MDISKELTKMIKGIKMGIYQFEQLEKKNSKFELKEHLERTLSLFRDQLDVMIKDASMADYRLTIDSTKIPPLSKWMIDFKVRRINSPVKVKKEAIKGLNMGVIQSIRFLEKHPNLDRNLRSQIQKITYQYKQMIHYIERA